MRTVAGRLRLELSQYEEVVRFARFGTEVDELTLRQIRRGERIRMALTQTQEEPRSLAAQVILLMSVAEGHIDDLPLAELSDFEASVVNHFEAAFPDLYQEINLSGELPDGIGPALVEAITAVRALPGSVDVRERAGLSSVERIPTSGMEA
jgi:F-type H+-transporting ATPase subunit alpha